MQRKPLVYVAAPFELQEAGKTVRKILENSGFICTSRWLDEPANNSVDNLTFEHMQEMAVRDEQDMRNADALYLINPANWRRQGTGGRHVETGFMQAWRRPVFIQGTRTNVYHFHPLVRAVSPDPATIVRAITDFFEAKEKRAAQPPTVANV